MPNGGTSHVRAVVADEQAEWFIVGQGEHPVADILLTAGLQLHSPPADRDVTEASVLLDITGGRELQVELVELCKSGQSQHDNWGSVTYTGILPTEFIQNNIKLLY